MFLESELYVTVKGAKYKETEDNYKWEEKYNITYLQLPVLYSQEYKLQNDVKIHAKIGPYFAIGLAAKNKWEEGYERIRQECEVPILLVIIYIIFHAFSLLSSEWINIYKIAFLSKEG